jgi:hypothetical protein
MSDRKEKEVAGVKTIDYIDRVRELEAEVDKYRSARDSLRDALRLSGKRVIGLEAENEKLEVEVKRLKSIYFWDTGSCEPLHLAAILGNRPCAICGENAWVKAEQEDSDE